MNEQFLRDRISQLRIKKGVSEYQMSLDLGHSRGYIQNISSGKSLPSITGLFEICEYFNLTPAQFFDQKTDDPSLVTEAISGLQKLDSNDRAIILKLIDRLSKK
jgi:transcriptional regulator with XRE-family HTH domain